MSTPPVWMTVNIRAPGHRHPHHIRLWLPLFIIGPVFMVFVLAAALIALPFILIAWILTWEMRWWRWLVHTLPGVVRMLWGMSGLRVDVRDDKAKVYIAVY